MRKQDERILDMMGRLEVVQSRVMAVAAAPPMAPPLPPSSASVKAPPTEIRRDAMKPGPDVQQPGPPESQVGEASQRQSQPPVRRLDPNMQLDETQLSALKLLSESSKNTRQLTNALERSREHTARVMKELYELGLVRRNDSTKPFVYQITDDGRRFAGGGRADPSPSSTTNAPPSP